VIGADEMAELEELRARLAVVVRQCESEKRAEAPSGIKYGRTEEASPYRSMEDLTTALMSERLWRAEVIKFVHEIRKVKRVEELQARASYLKIQIEFERKVAQLERLPRDTASGSLRMPTRDGMQPNVEGLDFRQLQDEKQEMVNDLMKRLSGSAVPYLELETFARDISKVSDVDTLQALYLLLNQLADSGRQTASLEKQLNTAAPFEREKKLDQIMSNPALANSAAGRDPAVVDLLLQLETVTTEKVEMQAKCERLTHDLNRMQQLLRRISKARQNQFDSADLAHSMSGAPYVNPNEPSRIPGLARENQGWGIAGTDGTNSLRS